MSDPEDSIVCLPQKKAEKKPKRKCSQKQLAALAAGRAKNKHFKPKSEKKNENEQT